MRLPRLITRLASAIRTRDPLALLAAGGAVYVGVMLLIPAGRADVITILTTIRNLI